MKHAVLPALVLSLAGNVFLLLRERLPVPEAPPSRAATADPSPAAKIESVPTGAPLAMKAAPAPADADERAAIGELEQRIAKLRAELAPVQGLSALERLLRSQASLRDKLNAIADLPREKIFQACPLIGRQLYDHALKSASRELMEMVLGETDPRLLRALALLLETSRGVKLAAEDLPSVLELLRHDETADRRRVAGILAARVDGKTAGYGWADAIAVALRGEADLGTVESILGNLCDQGASVPDSIVAAAHAAVERLPAGQARAFALRDAEMLRWDRGGEMDLLDRWQAAGTTEWKDDIAAAIGYFCSGPPPPTLKEVPRAAEMRQKLLAVYAGTASPEIRRRLFGSGKGSLWLWSGEPATVADFVRQFAVREPDADRRGQIERLADRLAKGAAPFSEEGQLDFAGGK